MVTVQEDYLINVEGDNVILGLAADNHMKENVQRDRCRDQEEVNPPTTGEALYVEEIYLGEVVLTQVWGLVFFQINQHGGEGKIHVGQGADEVG